METRRFGRTGLTVPVIGMGTWRTFDVRGAQAEAIRSEIVDVALESGANFFDSSPMYGEAERVLGVALRGRRERAIVATKVWSSSFAQGKQQIEQALRYFGGHVEVYQIHNLVAWEQYLPLLEEYRAQEKIRAVGITHYSHSAFAELQRIMETGRVDAIQIPYNAADRLVEREVLPLAHELNIGVIVMRPLGEGNLMRQEPPSSRWQHLRSMGVTTWAQVLLKWIVSEPRIHVAIPATSKPERMREDAEAGSPPFFNVEQREEVAALVARYV